MDFAIYIWCNKRLIMYRHLIRIRKGGGDIGEGRGGWGFKRNAIMSFYWLCWNQMPHVLWGKWRSLWPVLRTNFPLFFVILKINTFSRIRPITFSKIFCFMLLHIWISSGSVRYAERKHCCFDGYNLIICMALHKCICHIWKISTFYRQTKIQWDIILIDI